MADTSAWNRSTAVEPVWAALLEANAIGICAPVRLELLYSARGRADFAALRRDLLALPELTLDERAVTLAEQTQAPWGRCRSIAAQRRSISWWRRSRRCME